MIISRNGSLTRKNFCKLCWTWKPQLIPENVAYAVGMVFISVQTVSVSCCYAPGAVGTIIRDILFIAFISDLGELCEASPSLGWFWNMWQQTSFELHLGHNGGPCPSGGQKPPNTPDSPASANNGAREDINPNDILPHLCPPSRSYYLIVVDVTGIHFMTVNYCTCPDSDPEYL